MKRLLDLQDPSPLIERAQDLLAAAEPIDATPLRAERMRRELDRPVYAKAAVWTRVPALAVAGFVLLFGASSFAALRLWSAATHTEAPPADAAPEQDAVDSGRAKSSANRHESAAPSTAQPVETDSLRPPSASRSETRFNRSQRSSRRVTRASARPSEAAAPVESETRAASEPEAVAATERETAAATEPEAVVAEVLPRPRATSPNSELVVRAVRALRREGDPALAARLLDEYRARRSASPLGEEVLALQIEAAVANADARAARFAREYLTRYPAGRYAETARRALAEPSP